MTLDGDLFALGAGAQRFFFEGGFAHQPMGSASQQIDIGPPVTITARPEPGMVREQQRNTALALSFQNEQRSFLRAREQGLPAGRA